MSDTKYLETHEWYIVSENTFTVGISDFAQGELGDIVFVTLPEVGQEFSKGDAIVEVEATKTVQRHMHLWIVLLQKLIQI